ncbi:MAG TPA: hypothetical protein VKR53_10060 [Puia sp.]|nr:hypothetical protein [Puia sp.]
MNGTLTTIAFGHVGFPEGLKDHLASGWKDHCWDALSNYFQLLLIAVMNNRKRRIFVFNE